MRNYLFTSESVSEGHPDKMADQISDAVLDALLVGDPKSRVACETMISTGFVTLAGEVTTKTHINFQDVVRQTVKEIGYDDSHKGFDYHTCAILTAIDPQSPDIALGVDDAQREQGAGDQGLMFGYACNETKELMPLTLSLSHKLVRKLAESRKSEKVNWLRPDSKSQVTVEYENDKVKRIDTIVLSTQHSPDVSQEEIRSFIIEGLIQPNLPKELIDGQTKIFVNPTGRFVIGGPHGDCGLTGRKIIVDTYGGHGAHGGGAFSGKDATKVDRSAAYVTRHIAKNIVSAGLAEKCMVQVAYAIGVADPVSVMVNHYGTSQVDPEVLEKAIQQIWSLKPSDIIAQFDLRKPRFTKTATYGHFGREEEEFTWERCDKVDELKAAVKTLS